MIARSTKRVILSVAVVIACRAFVVAQDSGQVVRVSVGYGTMKNTPAVMAKLTPEARAEVDRLGELARAANGEGKYGDALKHLYHAMALMRGAEWTPARALTSALTLKLDRAMLDPGDTVVVRIGQMFALDEKLSGKVTATFSLLKLRGDETVKELKVVDSLDSDLFGHPFLAEVVTPDVEAGNYRVSVQIKPVGGEPIVKAYRSKVDGTLQPYQVFVPTGYDKSKPAPLVIALHGMGGDENSYFQAYGQGAFKLEAEKRGYIVACPKGRKPASMYVGDAEKDVMDVIAEVRRDYNIDPDRIYLTGHSMGGFGTWSVAMSHPDVFAALAPVAGGSSNPAGMSRIAHIPEIVIHGDKDPTVPVERSRVMVAMGKKLGMEIKYVEVPGGDHGSVVAPTFKDVFDWFDAHRRKTAEPKAAAAASKNN